MSLGQTTFERCAGSVADPEGLSVLYNWLDQLTGHANYIAGVAFDLTGKVTISGGAISQVADWKNNSVMTWRQSNSAKRPTIVADSLIPADNDPPEGLGRNVAAFNNSEDDFLDLYQNEAAYAFAPTSAYSIIMGVKPTTYVGNRVMAGWYSSSTNLAALRSAADLQDNAIIRHSWGDTGASVTIEATRDSWHCLIGTHSNAALAVKLQVDDLDIVTSAAATISPSGSPVFRLGTNGQTGDMRVDFLLLFNTDVFATGNESLLATVRSFARDARDLFAGGAI